MGAAACSDAVRRNASESIGALPKGRRSTSASSACVRSEHHINHKYWYDKMQMSSASQALFEGAQAGDVRRVMTALNAHGDPNCVNYAGYTALALAVGGGYKELLETCPKAVCH